MAKLSFIFLLPLLVASCAFSQQKNQDKENLVTTAKDSTQTAYFGKPPKGFSFDVLDVKQADSFLKEYSVHDIIENKLGKKFLFFPEKSADYKLVPCYSNGLIWTVQTCYDDHRPLVLSPDVIWLAICQGVSMHINQNFEELEKEIFLEDKPDEIIVRNDSLEDASKHWEELLDSLAKTTKLYTKADFYSFFIPEFSTTTQVEKTAYQVTLLESYKKAFTYVGESGCGIPSITLTGTTKDWKNILSKLNLLNSIGLGYWEKELKPIIAQFVSVSEGKIDKEFWQDIYKDHLDYNEYYISGWIIKFFPYIKEQEETDRTNKIYDEEMEARKVEETFKPNEFIEGDNYLTSTLSTDNFPSGISKIDVIWNNHFKDFTKNMEVHAGFFAMKQYQDKSLEPFISYAICEKDAPKVSSEFNFYNGDLGLEHNASNYWTPHIKEEEFLANPAVYNIKKFKTQAQSLEYIRELLLDSLKNNRSFQSADYAGDTISFVVFSNGNLGNVSISNSNNMELIEYVKNLLYRLPQAWFPALASSNTIDIRAENLKDEKVKMKVNSRVKLKL